MRGRAMLAATLVAVLACAGASASASSPFSVTDPANDANGVNDQGENVVRDVPTPIGSAPEADLLGLDLEPLTADDRVNGWRLRLSVQGRIGRHAATGEDLAYAFVAQAGANCRFSVTYRTDAGAALRSSPGCGGSGDVRLAVVVTDRHLLVDIPYRLSPFGLQAGRVLTDIQANTRLAPDGVPAVGQLDTLVTRERFTLPT